MAWVSQTQPADGYVIDLSGASLHVGNVLLERNGVTIRGAGPGRTRLRADGASAGLVVAQVSPAPPGGVPITEVTVEDLTLDGNDDAGVSRLLGSSSSGGPTLITARPTPRALNNRYLASA